MPGTTDMSPNLEAFDKTHSVRIVSREVCADQVLSRLQE